MEESDEEEEEEDEEDEDGVEEDIPPAASPSPSPSPPKATQQPLLIGSCSGFMETTVKIKQNDMLPGPKVCLCGCERR